MTTAVPSGFLDDVRCAESRGRAGDLRLLAFEAEGCSWESAGRRAVDEAVARVGMVQPPTGQVVLFTGHMVDRADRPRDRARFPRTAAAEATARALIEQAVRAEMAAPGGVSLGLAGGACGGDILFHEVCERFGIETHLYLALTPDLFQRESVDHGGEEWVARYHVLCERLPVFILQEETALPSWLQGRPDYNIWQRDNLWMLFNVLSLSPRGQTLVALYNRDQDPDGSGGTAHLVQVATARGFKAVELDARALLPAT